MPQRKIRSFTWIQHDKVADRSSLKFYITIFENKECNLIKQYCLHLHNLSLIIHNLHLDQLERTHDKALGFKNLENIFLVRDTTDRNYLILQSLIFPDEF